jgi:hypothetical protein
VGPLSDDGNYNGISISPPNDDTSGTHDAEVRALMLAIKDGLIKANRKFTCGIFVHKIKIYLDPKFLLVHLQEIHWHPSLLRNEKELFLVLLSSYQCALNSSKNFQTAAALVLSSMAQKRQMTPTHSKASQINTVVMPIKLPNIIT